MHFCEDYDHNAVLTKIKKQRIFVSIVVMVTVL